jgi:hypothetical protein
LRRTTAWCLAVLLSAAVQLIPGLHSNGPDPQAAFHLDPTEIPRPAQFAFAGMRLGHRIGSGFVLPGEVVRVEIVDGGVPTRYALLPDSGSVRALDGRTWEWTAPEFPGLVKMIAVDSLGLDTMRINVFVMVPYKQLRKGALNGYRIGEYPGEREIGGVIYRRPRGFVEITEANRSTQLSPHFTLGQFECNQSEAYPRYVVLNEFLVTKLEAIVDGLRQYGHRVETLGIMSGYRTPWYNGTNGAARYSRHQYGDAADFFVDSDADGRMDDLNGDGKVNAADARTLQCVIENLAVDSRDDLLPGGLGTYRTSHMHGPFVHTDARGFRARWGLTAGCSGS